MQTPCNQGARIRQVSEDPTKLLFEREDESTLDVTLTIVFAATLRCLVIEIERCAVF
jgi:hypothetical protein